MLFLSQSTISYQIKSLEEEVGFLLFDPGNRAQLTRAGKVLYEHAVRLQQDWNKSIQEARQSACRQRQILHIGIRRLIDETTLAKALRLFYEAQDTFGFILHTYRLGYFVSDLLHGNRDLLFADSTEVEGSNEIDYAPLCASRWGYALCANHPLAQKQVISFSDLNGESLMLPAIPPGMDESRQAIEIKRYCLPADISYSDSHDNAVLCASTGLCVSSINYSIPPAPGNVVFRPAKGYESSTHGFAWKKGDNRPELHLLIRIAQECFAHCDTQSPFST